MKAFNIRNFGLILGSFAIYSPISFANPLSFYSSTDGSTYTQFGTTADGANSATYASIVNNTTYSISTNASAPPVLTGQNLEVSFVGITASGAATIYVAVVQTGVIDPTITGFGISFGNAVTSTNNVVEAAATIVDGNSTIVGSVTLAPSATSLQLGSAAGLPTVFGLSEIFVATFGTGGGIVNASIAMFGVPEPMSLALLGAGLAATVATRNRRKSI